MVRRAVAQAIVYESFDQIKEKVQEEEPLAVFKKAVENIKPQLEVRSRRVGGATYQVPVDVRPSRRVTLALRWLTSYSRSQR
jgi:small subunit ribosomal protein S7